MTHDTFQDPHGVEIFTRWWTVDAPRSVVLISHGGAEHSGRYDRFARALNAAGHSAVALDMRGHGRTAPTEPRGAMGPGGGAALIDDLHELRQLVAERLGDVPVVVFGHSLGSLVSVAYLTQHAQGLAGAVLCGIPGDVDNAQELATLLHGAVDGGMADLPLGSFGNPNEPFEPVRTPFDWLSRDEHEVDLYAADPLCGDAIPVTFGFARELFDVVAPASEHLDQVTCPVMVIAGDQDSAGSMGSDARHLARALADVQVDVELTIYPGARHELLNETIRDDVTADVVAWLAAHT